MAQPQSRSELTIVRLKYKDVWYDLECEAPKVERKQDINTRQACNSYSPYEVNAGKEEHTVELPGVRVELLNMFNEMMSAQMRINPSLPQLAVYRYNPEGKWVAEHNIIGFIIESISQEGNEPFDVKGIGLKRG